MGLNSLRKGASGGILKIFLFGLLTMAVGGLVMMDVGGVFRGGISFGDIAKVGNESVTLNAFDRNVRNTLSRIGLEPAQAYQFGYIDQILGSDLRGRVLAQTAYNQSILVDDQRTSQAIKQMIEPIALRSGEDTKDIFNRMLLNQGLSESDFVKSIKSEEAGRLLTSAIDAGFSKPSKQLINHLYAQQNEKRDVEFIMFLDSKLSKTIKPSDEQLKALYTATREQYATPERRVIKIATINTDSLKEKLAISDDEILAEYEDSIDFYYTGKTQTIDQALLDTEEDAKAVIQESKSGKSLENAVKAATGKSIGYLGEQVAGDNDLITAIKDVVLANQKSGEVLGPIQSPLGWYVIHLKEIKEAHTQSLNEVRDEIKDHMIESQLFDQEYELANAVDDMLAGGFTLDEVRETIELNIETLPALTRTGQSSKEKEDALHNFDKERGVILETAFSLGSGESSNVIETEDNVFMIINVQEIQEKTYPEFASVKPELSKKWSNDQQRIENRILVKETLDELKSSGKSLKEFAASKSRILSSRDKLSRGEQLESPLTARTVANIFEATIGEPLIVGIDGGSAIAVVQSYHWPKIIDESAADYLELAGKVERDAKNEAILSYLTKKQNEIGVSINRALIQRVYGPDSNISQ